MRILCFIRNTRLHESGWQLARWPESSDSSISGHLGLQVIVRKTSRCPILLEIAIISCIFWRMYLSLPTCVEGRTTSFPILLTSPRFFFQPMLSLHLMHAIHLPKARKDEYCRMNVASSDPLRRTTAAHTLLWQISRISTVKIIDRSKSIFWNHTRVEIVSGNRNLEEWPLGASLSNPGAWTLNANLHCRAKREGKHNGSYLWFSCRITSRFSNPLASIHLTAA